MNIRQTYALLLSLYTTQYLAMGFFVIAMVAILRDAGVGLESLGVVYSLGLFWVLKLFWAPLIDRIRTPFGSHYIGWLRLMQSLMIINLLILAFFNPVERFNMAIILCAAFSFVSATQDIAADGLACRILPEGRRGVGNSFQAAGGLIGSVIGGGGVLMLYPWLEWFAALLLLAVITSISLIQLMFAYEPNVSVVREQASIKRLITVWRDLRLRWLLVLVLAPTGYGMVWGLIPPMLIDYGWSLPQIGFAMNIFGSIIGVISSLVTGKLIHVFGAKRTLQGLLVLQTAALATFILPTSGFNSLPWVYTALCCYFLTMSPLMTVLFCKMMARAQEATPATDYSAQVSLQMFTALVAAGAATAIASAIGYLGAVMVSVGFCILASLVTVGLAPSQQHRVATS